ncbi:MAG: ribose-5-phosphate isomerase RpiA [bacterium]
MDEAEKLKLAAAQEAVKFIKSGMIVGLGTGSTSNYAIKIIAEKLNAGELKNIKGIPSSIGSEKLAVELNIPLTTFFDNPIIDITLDGADEVDENKCLIKGGGGALLREKILAQASKVEIIMVDESKVSKYLGQKWALPVEVVPFALNVEKKFIESLGAVITPRVKANELFITDEGNNILDCNFGIIEKPAELAERLNNRAGIVEHGLFVNLCNTLIVATKDGILVKN